jgi:hypothetical protein
MTQTHLTTWHWLGSRTLWMAAALTASFFVSSTAFADVTCGDKTCPLGFTCESYESGACPAIATADGGDVACKSSTSYQCIPGPCGVDSDCADGMVCHASTTSVCSGTKAAPCDPNAADCTVVATPTPTSCTSTTTQQCVPRYSLPCQTATDCGPGFTCEEGQSCGCSGSAGSVGIATPGTAAAAPVAADGGAASTRPTTGGTSSGGSTGAAVTDIAVPSPPDCTCSPSGTFACKLQTIACNADADCPTGFSCVDNPGGTCSASSDGTTSCTPADPAKLCQPPYADLAGGVAKNASEGGDLSATATPTANVGPNGGAVDQGTGDPGSVSGSGCALIASPTGPVSKWFSLLLAVGLAFGMRRRSFRE